MPDTPQQQYLRNATGFTGAFGNDAWTNYMRTAGYNDNQISSFIDTANNSVLKQNNSPAPVQQSGASFVDAIDPRLTGLETGQSNIMSGVTQGLNNQQVLQQDIGAVGQGVGELAGFVGTPVNDGQTLFSTLGQQGQTLNDIQTGFVDGFDSIGEQIGNFQGLYEDNSASMMGTLDDLSSESAQQVAQGNLANRQLQDMQPAVYRTDQAIRNGFVPAPPPSAGSPQTNTALAQASQAMASMPGTVYGPQGVSFIDPRV